MKIHLVVAAMAVIGLSLVIITENAAAQVSDLPRISVVCESKNGDLKAVGDSFVKRTECKKNGRLVILGEESSGTGGGETVSAGNVKYLGGFILMKDGSAWSFNRTGWLKNDDRHLPPEVLVSDVLQWNGDYFLTKTGDVYSFDNGTWAKSRGPVLE